MPQDVASFQKQIPNGKCEINLVWNPPSNIATVNVSHYIVYINGRNDYIMNETIKMDQTSMFAVYSTCSCDSSTISISAVNSCDYVGKRTPDTEVVDANSLIRVLEEDCSLTTMSESCPRVEGNC